MPLLTYPGFGTYSGAAAGGGGGGSVDNHSLHYVRQGSEALNMTSTNFGLTDLKTFSFSTWCKYDTLPITHSNPEGFFGRGTTSTDTLRFRRLTDDTLKLNLTTSSGSYFFTTTGTTGNDTTTWHHYYVLVDTTQATAADRVKIYVDGNDMATTESTYPDQNSTLTETASDYWAVATTARFNQTRFLDGRLYQTAFFMTTLPTAAFLYNSGSPVDISSESGLHSHVYDSSGTSTLVDAVLASDWVAFTEVPDIDTGDKPS